MKTLYSYKTYFIMFLLNLIASNNCFAQLKPPKSILENQIASKELLAPVISTTTVPTEPLVSQFTNVCPSASYTYRIDNPIEGIEYVWSVADGNFVGSNIGSEVNVNFNLSTTQFISVFAKGINQLCNSTTVVAPIAMVTLSEASAGINNINSDPNVVCSSSTATYITPYLGADTYDWSIQPSSLGSISTGQNTNQVTVQWNNATNPSGSVANLRLTINKCSLSLITVQKPVTILNTPNFFFK